MKFYITKMDVLLERYLNFWLPSIDSDIDRWIEHYITQSNPKKKTPSRLEAMIAYVTAHDLLQNPIFDDLHHAHKYNAEYFSKITASLGPLLKKLTTGKIAELLSPDYEDLKDKRPILDWLQVIRNQQIVYVGLDSLTDREVSTAVGNAMFADLVSVAGRLYKFGVYDGFYKTAIQKKDPPIINVHADEINETMGDETIPLFNKGRGAGFRITAYTQTWSDMEVRLKTAAKAGQAAGNLGAIVMFRCTETKTVEMLLGRLPKVPILRVVPASSSNDTPHGEDAIYYRSTNEDRFAHSEQRLIEQTDISNLPKGQAFCLLGDGKFNKLLIPLPQQENINMPEDVKNILRVMNERT